MNNDVIKKINQKIESGTWPSGLKSCVPLVYVFVDIEL